ncbi:glycerate kinase [Fodinisporobacter ferrooxydans]|uniref:Glycerate kinase n=1 Tax=Fodinisporobacter ferrooxydans TaxID=2901836 RepID=A0ABY4CTQ6_9BACL|nr:glycerate kinase [Alicyclobacillaceae bacterium MYW30-H2]
MKIVLAPDSYKGSLTAKQACDAMEAGIRKVFPDADVIKVPMADGGEGTVQSLVDALNGQLHTETVANPLGEPVQATYGILGDGKTAVIEMAEASGLYLISKEQRDPRITTTYGTGELIKAALDQGCRNFILGIGGSATNDGGVGMAQALGIQFLDRDGNPVPFGGGFLHCIERMDLTRLDPRIKDCRFTVACDVDNPLCGEHGASHVFGPQKGANPEMVLELDSNLLHYATILGEQLGMNIKDLPGSGAAGGLGAGMVAFLGAELRPGIEIVLQITKLEETLAGADLAISGEGQCDFQTLRGKTPFGVAKVARQLNIPVILMAGSIGAGIDALFEHGIVSVFSIVDRPMSLEDAMEQAAPLMSAAVERVIRARFL